VLIVTVLADGGWLASIKCPAKKDPSFKFIGCMVVNDALTCSRKPAPPFDVLSVDAEAKLQQRAVWAFRGRRGSGCCFVGSEIHCGTETDGWVFKNEMEDKLIAGMKHVFEFVAKPIACDEDVPRTFKDTGCKSELENGVKCNTCYERAVCPKKAPSPFDQFVEKDWKEVKLRAGWAARGRWASGCCVNKEKKILCETTAEKPGWFATWKNKAMDAVGARHSRWNDNMAEATSTASLAIRTKMNKLMYGETDRQNVLAQYVEAKNNTENNIPREPRTLVGKMALWVKLRIEKTTGRLVDTDLAFKFGPTDPGWATAFSEYLKGVKILVPNWIRRNHESTGRSYAYKMNEKETVGIIGDWGTGNSQSVHLANKMVRYLNPTRFIHLGDIYYAGTREELKEYFVEPCLEAFKKRYPSELKGIVWNLPGNHDYYGGAMPFFDTLTAMKSNYGPYFSLSNKHWMILGLDTALNDSDPMETARAVKCTTLPKVHLKWAKKQIDNAKAANKGVIAMSHHMLFSCHKGSTCGSEKNGDLSYTNEGLYRQFGRKYIEQIDIWLWGHEHGYARYKPYRGLRFGYLIGNGGVPTYVSNNPYAIAEVDGQSPPKKMSPIPKTFSAKKGISGILDDFKLYCNGLLNLEFDGPTLKIAYHELREGTTYKDWKLYKVEGEEQTYQAGKVVKLIGNN
jgi:hypothetical protein